MDKTTIDTYNQSAHEYDNETAPFWQMFPRAVFDKFIESINGKKVLDVGSGPGRDAVILEKSGLDVVCLDASQAMIEICSKKGLKAILGDFNNMPFETGSFDAVWAYTSLLHVPKATIDKPLKEVSRVLRQSGIFGLGMIEGELEGYRESAGVKNPRWFSYYTENEIKVLLKKHGFKVIHFEKFKPKTNNYLNFICSKSSY